MNVTRAHLLAAGAALAALTAPAGAQVYGCVPGVAFGVQEYRCAECGSARYSDSTHTVYSFGAEPLIVTALPDVAVRAGDWVVAVNGHPITTRRGADHFSYPPPGVSTVTVRRGNRHVDLQVYSERDWSECTDVPARRTGSPFTTVARPRDAAVAELPVWPPDAVRQPNLIQQYFDAVSGRDSLLTVRVTAPGTSDTATGVLRLVVSGRDTSFVVDVQDARSLLNDRIREVAYRSNDSPADIARDAVTPSVGIDHYGAWLVCAPACVRTRGANGIPYWRFTSPPAVMLPPRGDAADHDLRLRRASAAGLRTGDIVRAVNGKSPLEADGALMLTYARDYYPLTLDIVRNGAARRVTLKGPPE